LIHYIAPTVWAWGKGRIPLMARNLDLLLTLFPFEKACFAKTNLAVEYVGHPLVKKTAEYCSLASFKTLYGLHPAKKILALFPGSRKTEIKRNFPIQLEAAKKLAKIHDFQIAVSLACDDFSSLFDPSMPLIAPQHRYDLMQNADLALATSGTVTLELALFQVPTVVNFAIRPLDVFLAQKIFRIDLPHYCIVNIIGGQTIFPEFFGPNLTAESLFAAAEQMAQSKEKCLLGCQKVRAILGDFDAAQKAAQLISERMSTMYFS
jgi:lipid-A-disaccharide synthase